MNLFRRKQRNRELDEEIQAHFQMAVRDRMERGEASDEALANVRREFGSIALVREVTREMWGGAFWERLRQDLRFALRLLARNPGFTLVAVTTLALGIGSCTAIFAFVDAFLLRPLPYRDPGRLVMIWEHNRVRNFKENVVSPANYLDWKARNAAFESTAVFRPGSAVLTEAGEPIEVKAQWAAWEFFPLLGVRPWRGRLFTADDDRPGAANVALISYRLWQQRFGGDENILHRNVTFSSNPCAVVGVLPPEFHLLDREVDAWFPVRLNPAENYRKTAGRYLMAIGRLRGGITLEQAQRQMDEIGKRLEREYPEFDKNWGINLVPLRDQLSNEVRRSLVVLMGAVCLLLLIACTNVANLLLARATSRQREIATRMALGAGRARLVRQLLTESAALGLAGAALGAPLAWLLLRGMLALSPQLEVAFRFSLDARVLAFCAALALATSIVFGLAPAMAASSGTNLEALRHGGRASSRRGRRWRQGFVALQVALTAVLLVSAGLLLQSFLRLQAVDPGLNASHLLTLRVSLPGSKYQATQRTPFFAQAIERIGSLPGVRSASAVSFLPFTGLAAGTWVRIAGRPPARPGEELLTIVRTVMPGYFRTMGIPLFEGRDFDAADNTSSAPLRFIVNQAFVRKHLAHERPLDQSISVLMERENPFGRIIGVVGDVKEGALNKDPQPTAYYVHAGLAYSFMTLVVRTEGDPLAYAGAVRGVIRQMDPNQPVAEVRSMEQVIKGTVLRQRMSAWVTVAFAIAALLLASVGLYGVLSYAVGERAQEIGIRLALGASRQTVLLSVVGQGMAMVLVGLLAGLAAAAGATTLLTSLLFGVQPLHVATFAAVAVVLAAVGLAAAYTPGRRATRLDPATVLRVE